jgi:hypothetical protein
MENKKSGYLIVSLFGLLIIVLTGSSAWQTLKFRSRAVQTDGTIVSNRVIVGGKKPIYKYSVLYTSGNGKEDTTHVQTKSPFLKAGEKLRIYYDPSAPEWAALDISVFGNFAGIIIGLLMVLWGFPSYLSEVKREKNLSKPQS